MDLVGIDERWDLPEVLETPRVIEQLSITDHRHCVAAAVAVECTSKIRWHKCGLLLDQRLRGWPSSKPLLCQRILY